MSKKSTVYGEPECGQYRISGMIVIDSPRQAMLLERVMVEAMVKYAGKPEETLLARWHKDAVFMRDKAKREGWRGWEDEYPVEHYRESEF